MKKSRVGCWIYVSILVPWATDIPTASAQDRLRQLSTYEHYARMAALIPASVRLAAVGEGPDAGHSSVNLARMLEFFVANLIPGGLPTAR